TPERSAARRAEGSACGARTQRAARMVGRGLAQAPPPLPPPPRARPGRSSERCPGAAGKTWTGLD
uniref:Uncharacterized protein n=1 Tax=Otolemur garnettii TaxID=30611 RepID=H0XZ63_OTOGA